MTLVHGREVVFCTTIAFSAMVIGSGRAEHAVASRTASSAARPYGRLNMEGMISPCAWRARSPRVTGSRRADVLAVRRGRGLPHLAGARLSLHPAYQLPPRASHIDSRAGFSLHPPVDMRGGA